MGLKPGGRLLSLDVFRGLTVALMIVVNNPGSWAHIYPPLRHAAWHGLTPTDLVFPFFLFIMGVSVALALGRHRESGAPAVVLYRKILRRTVVIFLLGLLLNGFPFGLAGPQSVGEAFANLRIMGVLQRIALCYLLTALVALRWPTWRGRAAVAGLLLVLYEPAMRLPLVAAGGGFELETNLVRLLDVRVLGPAHMYHVGEVPFDPEGLLSTLPAAVTSLLGLLVGGYLRRRSLNGLPPLVSAGAILTAGGLLLSLVEPLNKQLWTTSYTVLTGGLAVLALALCLHLVDGRGLRRGVDVWRVFGQNPLVAFLGSGLLARLLVLIRVPRAEGGSISLKGALYQEMLVPALGPLNGSLAFAVLLTGLWWALLWALDRRGWHIKV